jgi:hypothetical protein
LSQLSSPPSSATISTTTNRHIFFVSSMYFSVFVVDWSCGHILDGDASASRSLQQLLPRSRLNWEQQNCAIRCLEDVGDRSESTLWPLAVIEAQSNDQQTQRLELQFCRVNPNQKQRRKSIICRMLRTSLSRFGPVIML